ncbi:MAG: hypothetical protein GX075_00290 [Firmicutes bacterium]|nr:hypothetical protein [Bacillota bacterium]
MPQTFKAASLTPGFDLKEHTAYIVLKWDPVNGAKRYQVYYCVNDEEKIVWDSEEEHPNDPDSEYIAYLDLDEELSEKKLGMDCIDKPGQYDFRVHAFKSDNTVIYQFATVTVSLGMILGDFPTNIKYESGNNQLTWNGVVGADGYRIEIYKEAEYKTRLFDSFEKLGTLIKDTSFDLTEAALDGESYYGAIVNAYAVDDSGQPLEITRGIGGF